MDSKSHLFADLLSSMRHFHKHQRELGANEKSLTLRAFSCLILGLKEKKVQTLGLV